MLDQLYIPIGMRARCEPKLNRELRSLGQHYRQRERHRLEHKKEVLSQERALLLYSLRAHFLSTAQYRDQVLALLSLAQKKAPRFYRQNELHQRFSIAKFRP